MAEMLSEFGHLVGLAGGNNIQATTMPTYSSVPLGTIVQYIGTTTADYINGYFYKATATGWEQHDTQPASNADNSITAFKESSPALAAHAVDDYIRYNNVTYIVTAAIAIGDNLVVGTNIAVPTLDEGTVIYTPEAGGSVGGGHVIVNPSGTEMEQRGSLQFVDANVTDDSTNDKTKIENVKVINSESELANVSDGMYMGSYDDEPEGVLSADMVLYDSETTVEDELDNKTDKVASATAGNLAGLNASGNLTNSGLAAGNTSISSIGDGTVSGAISAENEAIKAIVNVYGGKNLFDYSFLQSQTYSDLTLIVNADKSISIFGTNNSGSTKIFYCRDVSLPIQKGSYTISGGLSSENPVKVYFYYGQDGNTYTTLTDEEINLDFSTTNVVNFTIHVPNGATVNTIIYPMLRDARISDSTYVPYAMTNRELTLEAKKTVHITSPLLYQNDTYDFSLLSLGFDASYKQYLITSNGAYPAATCGAWIVYIGDASSGINITILENHNLSLAINDNATKTFRLTYGYESGDAEHIAIKEL